MLTTKLKDHSELTQMEYVGGGEAGGEARKELD